MVIRPLDAKIQSDLRKKTGLVRSTFYHNAAGEVYACQYIRLLEKSRVYSIRQVEMRSVKEPVLTPIGHFMIKIDSKKMVRIHDLQIFPKEGIIFSGMIRPSPNQRGRMFARMAIETALKAAPNAAIELEPTNPLLERYYEERFGFKRTGNTRLHWSGSHKPVMRLRKNLRKIL